MRPYFTEKIFTIASNKEFEAAALELFNYQAVSNPVYSAFLNGLGVERESVTSVERIPFLPVEFFRSHRILPAELESEYCFESSGTTGTIASRHYIHDLSLYEKSFLSTFRLFYGEPSDYLITALLPSYTGRENSSLVYMVNKLINISHNEMGGFYKDNISELLANIERSRGARQKVLLIGVSFALLGLAENYSPDLSGVIVMETGGMKGRRKEITREELHGILTSKLNVQVIHSEYGMTELLSQAYSSGGGIFRCPPWMRLFMRDPYDPLSVSSEYGRTGGINIIDLANIWSCPFIATSDLGRLYEGGSFEVLGRFDNSDIRGCNLMVQGS